MSAARLTDRSGRRRPRGSDGARFDAYQLVTDQIIGMLEAGMAPWRQPWGTTSGVACLPISLNTGKPYRGINAFLLQVTAMDKGYSSPWWGTYDKIAERGGQVRRGERSTLVIFWKQCTRQARIAEEEDHTVFVLRAYRVFNADQADGLVVPVVEGHPAEFDPIAECEAAVAGYFATGPRVVYGGDRACYNRGTDIIRMPERASFDSPEHYYTTLFHEAAHSTGHQDRLARPHMLSICTFGDPSYSREELVAEMGAAFLSGLTSIGMVTLPSSASYLASWIRALRGDNKHVVTAAAQAQRAADLIVGIKHEEK